MAKAGFELITMDCGVTPQAQNTGTSPGLMSTGSPKSGFERSAMPICAGSPMWMGAPCTFGMAPEICVACTTWLYGMGRMETTILPPMEPAGVQSMLVRYMETLRPMVLWRISIPASMSSLSKLNEQPMTKLTKSSRQYEDTSVVSSTISPLR